MLNSICSINQITNATIHVLNIDKLLLVFYITMFEQYCITVTTMNNVL